MALSQTEKKNLVFEVCEQVNATSLLEDFLRNPSNPWFGQKLSAALNEKILLKQSTTKNRSNLLLPMSRLVFIFGSYVNSCENESHLSDRIRILDETPGSHYRKKPYVDAHKRARGDKLYFKKLWDSLIDDKGYPSSWKDMFTMHCKLQMESGPYSFGPQFMQDLRNKTTTELLDHQSLRDKVWGDKGLEDARKEDLDSWDWCWAMDPFRWTFLDE